MFPEPWPHGAIGQARLHDTHRHHALQAKAGRYADPDKAFDANARVLEPLAAAGKTAVIPPRTNRSSPHGYDRQLNGARHLIENFFAKIKQFRAIATRYEKTAWCSSCT